MVASTVHVDVEEDTTVYSRQQQRPSSLSISSKRFFVALLALTTLFILNEFYHLSSDQPTTQQLSTTDQHIAIGFSKVTLQHLLDTPDQQTEHQQQQEPLLRPQKDRRKKARVFDTYVADNHDVPDYVNTSREKLQYLLDIHDKPNGGFLDVDPNDPFA
ncbi:hypothetical protein BGX29_001211 [Mortierella sp. GBA35]|nr:hypothetical protein BGX29_001211 [Mortierella sp. GBA35]